MEDPIGRTEPAGAKDSNVLFEEMLRRELGDDYSAGAQGGNQEDENPGDVALEVRLKSSKWEFRVHGLNELKSKLESCTVDEVPDEIENYSESFTAWLSDRNASVQKAAVETIGAFFEKCSSSTAISIWSNVAEALFDKCVNQPRLIPPSVSLMANVFAAVETKKFQEPISGILDKFIDKKGNAAVRGPAAKQMTGMLNCVEKLMRMFGAMKFEVASFLPRVSKYTAVTDNPTKQAAYGVLEEVFVWLRSADFVSSYIGDKQKGELERRFSEVSGDVPQPTKRFRGEDGEDQEQGDSSGAAVSKPAAKPEIDFYDMIAETDILKELHADRWESSILEAVKWQQKQAAFDELTQACEKAKRLKNGDYNVFVSTATRAIQTEGNLVVITAALKACSAMANGLRKNYSIYARTTCSAAITKLGDRQKPVIVAATALMDALLYCSPFDSYIDDVSRCLGEKNVLAKENVFAWCLRALNHSYQKDCVAKFGPKLVPLALDAIDDPSQPVRYGAGGILCHIIKKGPKADAVRRAIDALPAKKKATADEVLSKLQSAPSAPVTPVAVGTSTQQKGTAKPAAAGAAAQTGARARGTQPKPVAEEPLYEVVLDSDLASEQVVAAMGEAGASIMEELSQEGWALRRNALDCISKWIEENPEVAASNAEAITVFLKSSGANNFKENNFNVNKSVIEAARQLGIAANANFTKACAVVFVKGYAEKIGDPKIGPSYKTLVLEYAALFSPRFVMAVMFSVVPSITNPKVHSETCALVEQLITDFGPHDTDITQILAFARTTLESKTPACRTGAMKMIVALHRYLGVAVMRLLTNDVKPALLSEIEAACAKAAADGSKPPQPAKRCRLSLVVKKSDDRGDEEDNSPSVDELAAQLLEQQIPRINIKESITPQLLKDLIDPKWNVRKDAAIKLTEIVTNEGKMHIMNAGLSELFSVLRSRIGSDQNRPTVKELLTLVATLGEALGQQACKQTIKMAMPAVFSKLSDRTSYIRDCCIHASSVWRKGAGLSLWLSTLIASQALNSTAEEKEVLTGFIAQLEESALKDMNEAEGSQVVEPLVPILYELATDKSKTIRTNAEAALLKIATVLPAGVFNREFRNLKTPNQTALRPLLNQCLHITSIQSRVPSAEFDETGEKKSTTAGRPTTAGGGSSNPEGFAVKLSALSTSAGAKRLEACRKAKWPLALSSDDIEGLSNTWRPFVNDPLLSSMFERSQVNKVIKAFDFWKSFVSFSDNFASMTPTAETSLLEILYKWSVSRIMETNAKLVSAACDFLETVTLQCPPDSPYYEISSSALLSSVLPQLLERTGIIGSSQAQLKDRLATCVRKVVGDCPPQAAFIVLMRGTASQINRAIVTALEEVVVLISKVGPEACQNLQRDVAKLASLAVAPNDSAVRNSAIKGLAVLHPFLGESLLQLIEHQPDVLERVVVYIEEHPELIELVKPEDNDQSPREDRKDSHESDRNNDEAEKNDTPEGDAVFFNEYGLKDFELSFEAMMEKLGFEKTLMETQEQLELYDKEICAQEIALYYQDLDEECRRIYEGKTRPNECDMAYLNGKLRLEEASKGTGRSLRLMEEIRKLHRQDASSIAEGSYRLSILLDQQETMTRDGTSVDWQTVLAPELICGVTAALGMCFDVPRLQKSEVERDSLTQAGQKLTELCNKLVMTKKPLLRISPVQLSNLVKMLLLAMSCHGTWSGCPDEEVMVKRLNSIVGSHIMSVVTPRNACTLVGMVIDFLLDDRETLGLEAALTIRVHRKLIRKMNSKHIANPTDQEKQYYLRVLDTAIICLMRLDSHQVFSQIESLVDVPHAISQEAFEEDFRNTAKLKAQMEVLIKELIFMAIVVLGLPLAGLYFRDIGYFTVSNSTAFPCSIDRSHSMSLCDSQEGFPLSSALDKPAPPVSGSSTTIDDPRGYRINQFIRCRLEALMNTEYSPRITITVCPNLAEADDPVDALHNTYESWHAWFVNHPTKLRTPPMRFPNFSLDEITSCAPEEANLSDIDKTLATGWVNRRDGRPGTDVKTAANLIQHWRQSLGELEERIAMPADLVAASQNAQRNMERGLLPYELIGHYIRKTISVCSDVGLLKGCSRD